MTILNDIIRNVRQNLIPNGSGNRACLAFGVIVGGPPVQ